MNRSMPRGPVRRSADLGRSGANEVAGWVPPLARVGYAAKGVVYLLVGVIALRAAFAAGDPEGASEALATLGDEGWGRIVLYLIAFGLAAHVLWRLVQAVLDPERWGEESRIGLRLFYLLSALIYGSLAVTAWQLASGDGGGGGGGGGEQQQTVWIAEVMRWPGGTWLVAAAGLLVTGYGLQQIWKGLHGNIARRMGILQPSHHRGIVLAGRIGTVARGAVLLPIGWFLFQAGIDYDPDDAASTDEVLTMLERGGVLAIVALGLAAYGAFQIAKALYRRIERPVV